MFLGKIPLLAVDEEMVKNEFPKEKVFGFFIFGQPNFMINDEDLAKRVLIKDFDYFVDRRTFDTYDTFTKAFLTNLSGAEWKQMRSLMSGVFTSGKLKLMANHIDKVGKNFEKYVSIQARERNEIDMKVAGGLMTLDSIASAGFGIEVDSFAEPDNTFRKMALTLVGAPGYRSSFENLKIFFLATLPKLGKFLKITFLNKVATSFFSDIIIKTYKRRMETGEKRNDIIDVLVEELKSSSKNKSQTYESDFEKDAAIDTSGLKDIKDIGYDEETLLIANALLFFFAGFETTSTGISIICHKLAIFPDLQEKVYNEINDVIGDCEDVSFEQLQEMKYMDMFISECCRYQTIIPALERKCVKDYAVPGTDIIIPKGRFVKVYTKDISNSEDNFKRPEEFDPENFAPENNPNKFGMMIFGQGPRNCIGMRYALLTIKMTIVYLLRKHKVVRSDKTTDVLVPDIKNFNVFKDGVFMKFEKRF